VVDKIALKCTGAPGSWCITKTNKVLLAVTVSDLKAGGIISTTASVEVNFAPSE
jgi:hypothetical protein